MEPLNNGHIGGRDFVLCREVVLFLILENTTTISLVPRTCPLLIGGHFFGGSFIEGSTVMNRLVNFPPYNLAFIGWQVKFENKKWSPLERGFPYSKVLCPINYCFTA